MLVYATGGLAFSGIHSSVSAELAPAAALLPDQVVARYGRKSSGTRVGGVIGGGVEFALTDSISIRAEYLHTDLASDTHQLAPDESERFLYPIPGAGLAQAPGDPAPVHPDASIEVREQYRFDTLRVGLSFRF